MGETIEFAIGQTSRLRRAVTAEVIDAFARVSTDDNPAHLDDAFAASTRWKAHRSRDACGIVRVGAARHAIPWPRTIYMGQSLKFVKPVFIGDTLDVVATVTKFRADKGILTMDTTVSNQHGETVVTGECVCLVSDLVPA
jgi:3-hydroxybutyryl-CoA dehydratase